MEILCVVRLGLCNVDHKRLTTKPMWPHLYVKIAFHCQGHMYVSDILLQPGGLQGKHGDGKCCTVQSMLPCRKTQCHVQSLEEM